MSSRWGKRERWRGASLSEDKEEERERERRETVKKTLDRRKAKCIQGGLFRCTDPEIKSKGKEEKEKIGQLPDRVSEANPDN